MFMTEFWLSVPEWEGLYEVSSHGRVRSCDRVIHYSDGRVRSYPSALLRPWVRYYPTVALQDRQTGRALRTYVHRLVCAAFHGPAPTPEHEVAHNDGNSSNGHYLNLRWATHAENEADKRLHQTKLIGERHGCAKLTREQAAEIKQSRERNCDLADRFGVTRSAITLIRNGTNWREALETEPA